MLMIKWSNLHRFYWVPRLNGRRADELWFIELRFLCFHISLFSAAAAEILINIINQWSRQRG